MSNMLNERPLCFGPERFTNSEEFACSCGALADVRQRLFRVFK
jgi:hypothetical protein